MKVLTLKQPWATLVAEGIKKYEFRSWKIKYRGKVLIHAGIGIDKDEMKNKGGYGDELYYPHTDYYNNIRGYFFSSPSAYKEYYILCVYYSGQILYEYFSTAGECGVRPVVCLKSNVGVNMKE